MCYLTYLINLLFRVMSLVSSETSDRVMSLTCVFMCMLYSHLTFSIDLCFLFWCHLFCFVFVILNIKIFCRSSNWRNRYAQCHSYRDAETVAAEVMKVVIYLVLEVYIILWNLFCSIGCKSYFYFAPPSFLNIFLCSRMINFWKEKKSIVLYKLALLSYLSKLCCPTLSYVHTVLKKKYGSAWDPHVRAHHIKKIKKEWNACASTTSLRKEKENEMPSRYLKKMCGNECDRRIVRWHPFEWTYLSSILVGRIAYTTNNS